MALEAAHGSESGLEPTVIGFDRVVRVVLDAVQRVWGKLVQDPRVDQGPVEKAVAAIRSVRGDYGQTFFFLLPGGKFENTSEWLVAHQKAFTRAWSSNIGIDPNFPASICDVELGCANVMLAEIGADTATREVFFECLHYVAVNLQEWATPLGRWIDEAPVPRGRVLQLVNRDEPKFYP